MRILKRRSDAIYLTEMGAFIARRIIELVIMLTLGADEGINHVKVFSQLARKLANKQFRQSLFAAENAESILALLEAELTF